MKLSETGRTRILTAMLDDSNKSLAQIAAAAGISRRSLYAYLREPAFADAYSKARDAQLFKRAEALESRREKALAVIEVLMDDENVQPAVRLKAAAQLLSEAAEANDKADSAARSAAFGASAGF